MYEGPILVFGSRGQLARSLNDWAIEKGVAMMLAGRPQFDIEKAGDIERTVVATRPKAIINAAAYTAVDGAEDEPERAFGVNCHAAQRLATVTRIRRIPLVHISTDYVFDGRKTTPYVETDPADPVNAYGRSKRAGEKAVLEAAPQAVVIRTSWVYGPYGNNFLRTMLKLAEAKPTVRVVNDQYGAPTFSRDLAAGIMRVVAQLDPKTRKQGGGIYHLVNSGQTTWHDFAAEIFRHLSRMGEKVPTLRSVAAKDYPSRARRPRSSRLDTSKIALHFGVRLRSWRDALVPCLDELVTTRKLPQC
jgi:dTDP-4-dehydrorhamnose reductase